MFFFFSSRRRHTRSLCDWSSDVCSSDLIPVETARTACCSWLKWERRVPTLLATVQLLPTPWVRSRRRRGSRRLVPIPFFLFRSEERREGKSVCLGDMRIVLEKK